MIKGRLLLTGATGFIGGYLLDALTGEGYEVIVAVRKESRREKLSEKGIQLVEVDYSSESQMREALSSFAPIDYVVHTAGITKSINPALFKEVNAEQTKRLLSALPSEPKRFVLMSSVSSYGNNPTTEPISAQMGRHPNTEYGRSKLLAEQYVAESGVPFTILCPTGVYGYGDEDYLLSIESMRHGWSFVSGLEPQKLSFIYVRDVVKAVTFVLEEPRTEGGTYLLSDGKCYLDSEFTAIVESLLEQKVREIRVPLAVIRLACGVGELLGKVTKKPKTLNKDKYHILSQRNWVCDISPLRELGFEPDYDLKSGLTEALKLAGFTKD